MLNCVGVLVAIGRFFFIARSRLLKAKTDLIAGGFGGPAKCIKKTLFNFFFFKKNEKGNQNRPLLRLKNTDVTKDYFWGFVLFCALESLAKKLYSMLRK